MYIYKYPLFESREITDLRDMLNQSEQLFADRNAFLIKDPVALREVKPRSKEALNYKSNPKDEYRGITYKQYAQDVRALGTALQSLGIKKDDKVVILAGTRYEWYVSYLAVVSGLAIVVPMDKHLNSDGILNNFERCQATTVIYSNKTRATLLDLEGKLPAVENYINMDLPEEQKAAYSDTDELSQDSAAVSTINGKAELYFWDLLAEGDKLRAAGNTSYDDLPVDPDAFNILLFTSGTTSKSKAVMLSHRNICTVIHDTAQMLEYDNTTILSVLPLHHTYEATCGFLTQIYNGASIALSDGLRNIALNLRQTQATMILLVPAFLEVAYRGIWRKLNNDPKLYDKFTAGLKHSKFLLNMNIDVRKSIFKSLHDVVGGRLRYIIVGGAPVDPEIVQFFNDIGLCAIQGYGLTESSPIFALNREHYKDSSSAGLPMPSIEAKIIDQDEHGIGEIIGRGPAIMLGYYQDEELTRKAIDAEGYYHTGDYGYIDKRGFIHITGRKANIIVAKNGENVFPEELESILLKHAIVKEVVVYGKDEVNGDKMIVAEILPDQDYVKEHLGEVDLTGPEVLAEIDSIVKAVNKKLQSYQKIRSVKLRAIPFERNTSNKIVRAKI